MSRKSNKFFGGESEVVEGAVEEQELTADPVVVPEINETVETIEAVASEVDPEQTEEDRLNRVNDLEKQIIQHQEQIKMLRSELRKLDGKAKREGPTKMETCLEVWKSNPGLTRKEYVELFINQANLTPAGARTYIQLILAKNK
jgi:hypothetical protein